MKNELTVSIPLNERNDLIKTRTYIQTAIDRCHNLGGGSVFIPSGKYLTSSIEIKSQVTLCLASDCFLISPVEADQFNPLHLKQNDLSINTPELGYAMIYAQDSCDIGIEGGVIIGCGEAFWTPMQEIGELWCSTPPRYYAKPFRPMTLLLKNCQNISIKSLVIQDSPAYSAWLLSCQNVHFQACRVENNFYGPNTDGYHFSSCFNVLVEDCYFQTGDDSLAVDGNDSGFSKGTVIRNCTFNSAVNVLRIYTGLDSFIKDDGSFYKVRDVKISHCKVLNAAGVVNVTAQYGQIEDIVCENLDVTLEQEGTPFFLMTDRGSISKVTIKDCRVRANGVATFIGTKEDWISDVILKQLNYLIKPKKKLYELDIPDPIPNYGQHHFAPCNLYLRYVSNIEISDVIINWEYNPVFSQSFSAVKLRFGKDILIKNLKATAYNSKGNLPTIEVSNSKAVNVI